MANKDLRLALQITAEGAAKTVAELQQIKAAAEAAGKGGAEAFGLTAEEIARAQDQMAELQSVLGFDPSQVFEVARAFEALNAAGVDGLAAQKALAVQFGITAQQAQTVAQTLANGLGADAMEGAAAAAATLAQNIAKVDDGGAGDAIAQSFEAIAEQAARAEAQIQVLQAALGIDASGVLQVAEAFDALIKSGVSTELAQKAIAEQFGATAQQAQILSQVLDQGLNFDALDEAAKSAAKLADELGGVDANVFGSVSAEIAKAQSQLKSLQSALNLEPEGVIQAAQAFESLRANGIDAESAQKALASQLGLTAAQAQTLTKSLGSGFGAQEMRTAANAAQDLATSVSAIDAEDAGAIGVAFQGSATQIAQAGEQLKILKQSLNLDADGVKAVVSAFESMVSNGRDAATAQKNLATLFDLTEQQALQVANAVTKINGGALTKAQKEAAKLKPSFEEVAAAATDAAQSIDLMGAGGGIAALAFKFNNVIQAVQSLAAAAQPAYNYLIGANEELNAQILQTQTNLASSSRIFAGGVEITNNTEKIKATQAATTAAIKQIEKDTQSLVGVTSAEVNELFSITITNASALNKQSKEFPDPIQAATQLTKGWAASLKVLNIPLNQAREEINSILKGQITQDSVLAKSLGITTEQVNLWKGQGRLVDEVNKKLQVFVDGNAIAARSIDGISSNIKDLFERLGRSAGEPLLEPTIDVLAQIEAYLKSNEQAITQFFKFFVEGGLQITSSLGQTLQPALEGLIKFAVEGGELAQQLFSILGKGLAGFSAVLGPVLGSVITFLAEAVGELNDIAELIQFREIVDGVEALESYSRAAQSISDEAIKTASSLKALNKAQEENGKLTAEQAEKQARLRAAAKLQVEAIDDQIVAIKGMNAVTPELQAQRDAEIASLEKVKVALAKTTGTIEIQGKTLEELGNSYKQLQSGAENAQRVIQDQAQGDSSQFAQSVKSLIDLTQQQVELGQISAAEAEKRLSAVAQNTKVEVDLQQSAQEAIRKVRKQELDLQLGDVQAQQARIEAAQSTGQLGPLEAAQELTKLKKKELDIQLADVQRNIAAEQAAIAKGSGSKSVLAELQAQEIELQAKASQESIAAEKRTQEARLQVVEQSGSKRVALAELVEAKANAEISKLQRQGAITSEEAEARKLAASQKRIAAELQSERDKLAALEGLGTQTDPEAEADRQAKITAAQTKAVELQAGLDETRAKSAEASYAAVSASADRAIKKVTALEQAREIEVQKLVSSGVITAEDAESRKLKASADRIKAELNLEKQRIAEIAASELDPEAKAKATQEAEAKAGQLTLQLLQNQAQQEEQLRSGLLKSIQRDADKRAVIETQAQAKIQEAVNSGQASIDDIEKAKLDATRERIQAQLVAEEQALAKIAALPSNSANAEATLQAEQRVATLRLQLAEQVAAEQAAAREKELQATQAQAAAEQRAIDAELSGIADVKTARDAAATAAEVASQREIAAIEAATNGLSRQTELLNAKAELTRATNGLAQSSTAIQIEQTKRAAEIQAQLSNSDKLSLQERAALTRELGTLGVGTSKSAIELLRQQQVLEDQLAQQQRAALLEEQAQAQAQLTLDNQRNQLASNRAVLEAKINELKAKAAVLDAQAAIREQQLQAQRQIAAAKLALAQAQSQPASATTTAAVAAAQAEVTSATASAQRDAVAAKQALDLAKQQAALSTQSTAEAEAAKVQQAEIATLSQATLSAQQQQALAQAQATELARENAQVLALAKTEAEAIAAAAEREAAARERSAAAQGGGKVVALPGRRTGGDVRGGKAYVVGEDEPEVFIPKVSGTILNQSQIAANLATLQSAQAAAHGKITQVFSAPAIGGRVPPKIINQQIDARVSNTFVGSPTPMQDAAKFSLEAQRQIIARGKLR